MEISEERSDILTRMDYDQYLESPEWKALREPILERDRHRCRLCNYPKDLHVHHRFYCKRGTERFLRACFKDELDVTT